MQFRILDLFCGAGGLSYGLDSIENFTTVLAVDNDAKVLKTFEHNIKNSMTYAADLTDDNEKRIIIEKAKQLKVNMIVGGPPCQGFSLKGKNLGLQDPRNFLFKEFLSLVRKINPEIVVIENVKNLINASNHYFIDEITKILSDLSYIVNYGVYNAKYFGVPQNRERTIIIASKSRSIQIHENTNQTLVTVRDAISDLAYLESGEGKHQSTYLMEPRSDYQKLMRQNSSTLYNHEATKHSNFALQKLKMIPPEGDKTSLPKNLRGKQKFTTTWSRLVWDSQSPTIDTRFDTPSNGRNSHPFLNRAITPREAARLQSFPDTFEFIGNKCSICKQIGNAVPPLFGKAIASAINKAYDSDNVINTDDFVIFCNDAYLQIKALLKQHIQVDHIITDPPYNISKENNFSTLHGNRKGIDFGEWDKDFDLYGWISEYAKILKPNGSFIIFCSYLYISYLITELERNEFDVKDILEWKKNNPMPRNIKRRYVQDTEYAIWAVRKKAKWVFNKPNDVSYLRPTFYAPLVSGSEKTIHPTQKSLKIMEDIIKIHTNENETILDPFMGSGTTGVACLKHNRKFMGIEINKEYFNISANRLLNANTQKK